MSFQLPPGLPGSFAYSGCRSRCGSWLCQPVRACGKGDGVPAPSKSLAIVPALTCDAVFVLEYKCSVRTCRRYDHPPQIDWRHARHCTSHVCLWYMVLHINEEVAYLQPIAWPPMCHRAAIAYKVKAHLDREGAFTKDAKHACPLNVMERSKSIPRAVAISKDEVVSYYCCFNKGMILLDASMPTDTLTPGDNNPVPIMVKVSFTLPCHVCSCCCDEIGRQAA